MQITRFRGKAIHGYLNFDVTFNSDLTFLTGINGSGKTSVIQSIIALISPSFFILANLDFRTIQVDLVHDNRKMTLMAHRKDDGVVTIEASETNKSLVLKPFVPDNEETPPYRAAEKEQEYYREFAAFHAKHEVMQLINRLPTPMFLDLDRRARALLERREGRYIRPTYLRRATRNIFSQSLAQSLEAATSLAEAHYRDSLIAIGRFADDLRVKMILDILELEPVPEGPGLVLSAPTESEISTVKYMRTSVEALPRLLGLPRDDIEKRLIPTLDRLQALANAIPKVSDTGEYLRRTGPNDPGFRALFNWSASRSLLAKLVKMVERVSEYTERRKKQIEQSDKYLQIVNSFLRDSGKEIYFDETGFLSFRIDGLDGSRPTSSLSSGEGQLFVIITHLFFNPLAREANVFIIDEPELSLHVQWQELFVQSIMSANPNVQYILATHSPSIILDRISACRDLSKANERGLRG